LGVLSIAITALRRPLPWILREFKGSFAFELEHFNVRVNLVEPSYAPTTKFASNGIGRMKGLIPEAYKSFAEAIFAAFARPTAVTTESDAADAVWHEATLYRGPLVALNPN
jgi:hypothetical protein